MRAYGGKGSLRIEAGGQVSNNSAYVGYAGGSYSDYAKQDYVTVPANGSVVVKCGGDGGPAA